MKLLLISVRSEVSHGGIATWTERFLERCNAHEIDCTIVNTEAVGKRAMQGNAKRNLWDEVIRTRRIFRNLNKSLSTMTYDVVHLNTSCGNFGLFRDCMMAQLIKKKGLRLVTHFHCDIPYWIHNSVSRKCLGELSMLSDERLVLCENSRLYLKRHFGIDSKKVPNFLNEELIRQEDKAVSPVLSSAIFVGRVSEAKGAREIWELASRMPQIEFRLVGEISDIVAKWNKPNNIKLLGRMAHHNVIASMDDADIFLFPSYSEGFSLALTEAMARGLPSVATDVGANADMLTDGCGIITNVGDVDAMQSALEQLNDARVRMLMSRNAVNKVRSQYTTDVIIEQFRKYYCK